MGYWNVHIFPHNKIHGFPLKPLKKKGGKGRFFTGKFQFFGSGWYMATTAMVDWVKVLKLCVSNNPTGRPSKSQKIYTNRILREQNLRQKVPKCCQVLIAKNAVFNQIYFNSTVFNIRLYKRAS